MKKKINSIFVALVALVMTMSMTGCSTDDDGYAAYLFEGYWEGRMGSVFYDELGYGTDYYYSQLDIVRTDEYGGYGQERDYYNSYSYTATNFEWEARDGYIYFYYDFRRPVVLNFGGSGDRIYGQVFDPGTYEQIGNFDLRRINTWYDDWYDDPYWAKPNQWSKEIK